MPKSSKIELGDFRENKYFPTVEINPGWDAPEKYVATVYYRDLDLETLEEKKVEVVRIENKAHGFCHMDRLFEEGEQKKRKEMDVYEAWKHLQEKWRKYARRYENK
jgi:hypothetical protein